MIEPLSRYTSIGIVEQKGVTGFTVALGSQTVLTNIPSIFGKSITVFISTSIKLKSVTIRNYALSRTLSVDNAVMGVVGAGVTLSADQIGQVGESYDILVDSTGAGTINVWTCVRQA